MRKVILIIFIIIILVSVGAGIFYWFYLKPGDSNSPPINNDIIDENGGGDPIDEEPEENVQEIQKNVLGAALSVSQQSIYYFDEKNFNLYQITLTDEEAKTLNADPFTQANRVRFSPNREYAVLSQVDKSGNFLNTRVYNLKLEQTSILPQTIRQIEFSPDSEQIVYQYVDRQAELNRVAISDPDGKNWKNILHISFTEDLPETLSESLKLNWWQDDKIVFNNPGEMEKTSTLFVIDPAGENLNTIIADIAGLEALPSPFDSKVLFSTNAEAGKLAPIKLIDLETEIVSDLTVKAIAPKCLWFESDSVFCAVPQNLASDTKLPDALNQKELDFHDQLIAINTATGKAVVKYEDTDFPKPMNIEPLFFSSDQRWFYFINQIDNTLYRAATVPREE